MRASTWAIFTTATFAALAGVSSASAADLAARPYTKAPPIIVPVYNWTGLYIGGNAGYSWGRSNTDTAVYNNTTNVLLGTGSAGFDMNGWVAGGQIGYNWQNQNWVWGLEGDIQGTGQKGSAGVVCPGAVCNAGMTAIPIAAAVVTGNLENKLEWFSTIRGRVGYTFAPTVLGYVTGGAAIGGVNSNGTITGFSAVGLPVAGTFSGSDTKVGWTVGAGVEASLGGNWTGKLEYLYMDLGTYTATGTLLTNSTPLRLETSSKITDNILRVGVNYRFGGPVVAKY